MLMPRRWPLPWLSARTSQAADGKCRLRARHIHGWQHVSRVVAHSCWGTATDRAAGGASHALRCRGADSRRTCEAGFHVLTTWVHRAARPQAKSPAQLHIDLTASVTDYVGQFLFARVEDRVLSDVGLEAPVGFVAHGASVFIARACGLCCGTRVGLTYADRCCMPQMVSLCSRSEP